MNIFKLCQTRIGTALRRCIHTSSTRHVELTSVRYPDVKRGNYGSVGDSDLATFERLLSGRVLTDSLDGYNTDWLKTCRGYKIIVIYRQIILLLLLLFLQADAYCEGILYNNLFDS